MNKNLLFEIMLKGYNVDFDVDCKIKRLYIGFKSRNLWTIFDMTNHVEKSESSAQLILLFFTCLVG